MRQLVLAKWVSFSPFPHVCFNVQSDPLPVAGWLIRLLVDTAFPRGNRRSLDP